MEGVVVKCLARGDSLLVLAFVANHWTPSCPSGLQCCSWKIMDHPPHSPDLARSDFHCFEPLKKQLAGKWFVADTNFKQVVTHWLQALNTKFLVCHYTSISAMVGQTLNTFTAIVDLSRFNNSCLKSPASTLVDLTFQSRALRSFSLNQLRNLSL